MATITVNGQPVEAPAGALAWKHADPTEEARWVYGIADAREIAAADPSLLVWVDPVWSEQSTEHECLDCGAWVACDASVGLPPCEASCHACRAHDDTCPAFWHAGDRCEAGIPGTGDYDTGTIAEEIKEYSALVSWDSGVRTPVDLADLREIDPERMERTAAALRERGDAAG